VTFEENRLIVDVVYLLF